MVVQYKGSSLVFKASSQYAVEKIRSFLESKLNTKLKPLLGIIEPYMQSQEKLGVTFSQTLFVLVLAFCFFFTICDTKTTPSSILLAILILKNPLNNSKIS